MSQKYRYMLIFSLGPVQPFIQQARKTRDLWIGSLLLAKLMEAAMKDIPQECFVFPASRTVGSIPDIPNKYIALFADLAQAQAAVQKSQQQIAGYWQDICSQVWQEMLSKVSDQATLDIWRRQTGMSISASNAQADLSALFEIYWAIVDRQEDQRYADYSCWFEAAEGRLAARKRLRDFKAREEPGEKSAISGEREVLRRKDADARSVRQFWQDVARRYSQADLDKEGKERLDAIDVVKRFAMQAETIFVAGKPFQTPFPSTSSLATASFVERLLAVASELPPQVLDNWRQITGGPLESKRLEATRDIPYLERIPTASRSAEQKWILQRDGDLYFTASFVPRRLKEEYGIIDEQGEQRLAKAGEKALKALLGATDDCKITRPRAYYAVLQMDGDKMGMLLSGVKDEEEHREISNALSRFARERVPSDIEQRYPARLVYAGGDDVLAFAPLARDVVQNGEPQHVLELAEKLQESYRAEVGEALAKERTENVTASVGIVLASHMTSLSYVLRLAREAEDIAKKRYGRNALVVTLVRSSGEQTRVGCHWCYPRLEDKGQPLALFSRFYQLFKHDILSPKCVYTLLEEAPALVKMEIDVVEEASAMQSEIKRVLKRQREPRRKDDFSDSELHTYAWHLTRLAAAMDADEYPRLEDEELPAVELHADKRRYGLVEVLGWLLVMAFLARKERE